MASPCRHCGQPHEAFLTMCPVTGGRLGSATYTLVNDDEALVGTIVGDRYHVREILGQGSTGTVFGTVHIHFDRRAAMKVLRPRLVLLDTIQRVFHGETRAAFNVSHPSVCEVFDIGTLPGGAPFFVMERLDGDPLSSRLGRERFSTASAVDLLMQLLSALEAIHARDLLCRDLRPQNLFLAQRRGCRPVLKLLDLGLSRLIPLERVRADWDALRAVVGANDSSGSLSIPYYLSPERARGDQSLEPASDLFIAAAIFYEALTGLKAFNASTWIGIVQLIEEGRPTPLIRLRPDVPEELNALVMRTLSPSPHSRPATAREMQDELRSVFEGTRRGSSSIRRAPVSAPVDTGAEPTLNVPPRTHREPMALHGEPQAPPQLQPQPMPQARDSGHAAFASMRPSAHSDARNTDRPTALITAPHPDLFEEETCADIDRKGLLEAAMSLRAEPVDEASADHPVRTVRPIAPRAGELDVDIDVELGGHPATSRGTDLAALRGPPPKRAPEEDEETATMQLTPDVRARIEQLTKAAPGSIDEDSTRPPPTRRRS